MKGYFYQKEETITEEHNLDSFGIGGRQFYLIHKAFDTSLGEEYKMEITNEKDLIAINEKFLKNKKGVYGYKFVREYDETFIKKVKGTFKDIEFKEVE